jgi:hypothetical protein
MDLTLHHLPRLTSTLPAFLLSGYVGMASQNAMPALYTLPPQISTPLFKSIIDGGHIPAVALAMTSLISSAVMVYLTPATDPTRRGLWAGAALAVLTVRFYTQFIMMPGIRRLFEIGQNAELQVECESSGEHLMLLKRWVRQNWFRFVMAFGAGLMGWLASVT